MTSHAVIDTELAIDLRKRGLPWYVVAEHCKSTIYLVRRALSAAGITHWKRYQTGERYNRLLTPHALSRVKRLKAAGATWKELGRITGIDPGKLQRYVNRH